MDDSIEEELREAIDECDGGGEGFVCRPRDDAYRLRLWGRVPERWAGNLALHCFASALNIEAADALRVDRDRWAAAFALKPRGGRLADAGVDFLAMARRAPRLIPSLPETTIRISVAAASDCAAFARVSGPDSIGLLAEVLRRFARFDLYPRRLKLRTYHGHVDDWFWLERSAGVVDEPRPTPPTHGFAR